MPYCLKHRRAFVVIRVNNTSLSYKCIVLDFKLSAKNILTVTSLLHRKSNTRKTANNEQRMSSQLISESVLTGVFFFFVWIQLSPFLGCRFLLMLVLCGLLLFLTSFARNSTRLQSFVGHNKSITRPFFRKRPRSGLFGNVAGVEKPVSGCLFGLRALSQAILKNEGALSHCEGSTKCPPPHSTPSTASRKEAFKQMLV